MDIGESTHENKQSYYSKLISGYSPYVLIEKEILDNVLNSLGINFENNESFLVELFLFNKSVMLLIDPEDGSILLANLAALDFYQYSLEKIISMNISEINVLSYEEVKSEMLKAKKFKRNHFKFVHRIANNSICNVDVFSTPFVLNSKMYLLSTIVDTTDFKVMESELKRANNELIIANSILSDQLVQFKAINNRLLESEKYLTELNSKKDRFLSILSHDMKNNLRLILDNSAYLKSLESQSDNQEAVILSDQIYDGINQVNDLLENLLDWSRMQSGRISIFVSDYNLRELVENNLKLFKNYSQLKKIKFCNEIPDNTMIKSDLNIINTIFRNLLSNAIKYSYAGGMVKVGVANMEQNYVTVFISDNGVGIDELTQQKILNIRFINKRMGTMGESGSGLGLILVKDLLDGLGGKIWFDSTENVGTNFYFTIYKG